MKKKITSINVDSHITIFQKNIVLERDNDYELKLFFTIPNEVFEKYIEDNIDRFKSIFFECIDDEDIVDYVLSKDKLLDKIINA